MNVLCYVPEYICASIAYRYENKTTNNDEFILIVDIGYLCATIYLCHYIGNVYKYNIRINVK